MKLLRIASISILFALPTASFSSISTQNVRIRNENLVTPNGGMTPPQLIEYRTPVYTDEARRRRIEGVVTVEAEFDINGNFKALRIAKGLGFGLDEQALEVLKTYRFGPAYRSGGRVGVIANIDVAFKLPADFDDIIRMSEKAGQLIEKDQLLRKLLQQRP